MARSCNSLFPTLKLFGAPYWTRIGRFCLLFERAEVTTKSNGFLRL